MEARFFYIAPGNRLCASFVLAIEAERRLVGISELSALYAFVHAKVYKPVFLQKLKTVCLVKFVNLTLG